VKTLRTAREIAIEVVKFGATDMEVRTWIGEPKPTPLFFNNGYSEFEHTQPAGLGTRTAMNTDEINI
jgi:hypothetical protein